MKILIALIFLATFVCAQEGNEQQKGQSQQDYLVNLAGECKEKIGLDEASAKKLMSGDFDSPTKKTKCFLHCFLKAQGFFDDEDEPQRDVIFDSSVTTFPSDRKMLIKIVEQCTEFEDIDPCENAYWMIQCIRDAADKVNAQKKEKSDL